MRKYISQVAVAVVCALLGFLLAYQFKLLNTQEKRITNNQNYNQQDLTSEIEQLKKEKEEYEKKNNEVLKQLKEYENAAANKNDTTKELKKQLDDTRMILGSVDVQGSGIVLYLTPKKNVFSSNVVTQYLTDNELVYVVNELFFAGAEAISINDKRITMQTGIKSSSGNNFILINDEKISTKERITIKAIGDKTKLIGALDFPGALDFNQLVYYEIKRDESDNIKMTKFDKMFKYEYIKPIK